MDREIFLVVVAFILATAAGIIAFVLYRAYKDALREGNRYLKRTLDLRDEISRKDTELAEVYVLMELALDPDKPLSIDRARELFKERKTHISEEGETKSV